MLAERHSADGLVASLLVVVQRDNADTDQLHARNALQSRAAPARRYC